MAVHSEHNLRLMLSDVACLRRQANAKTDQVIIKLFCVVVGKEDSHVFCIIPIIY